MIDSNLSWKHLSDYICHEVSKSIEIVAKLRHHFPRRLLFNIYHTLIAPFINCGICAWGSRVQVYQKRLLVLQKRDFHLIFFFGITGKHAVLFFAEAKCLPLSFSFFKRVSYLMYDIHEESVPSDILSQFTKTSTIHNYNTRSSSNEFFQN